MASLSLQWNHCHHSSLVNFQSVVVVLVVMELSCSSKNVNHIIVMIIPLTAKIQVNNLDICWTLDLIQYLAQLERNSRKIPEEKLWSHSINNHNNPACPKSNPSLCGGSFGPSMSHHLIFHHNIDQCSIWGMYSFLKE